MTGLGLAGTGVALGADFVLALSPLLEMLPDDGLWSSPPDFPATLGLLSTPTSPREQFAAPGSECEAKSDGLGLPNLTFSWLDIFCLARGKNGFTGLQYARSVARLCVRVWVSGFGAHALAGQLCFRNNCHSFFSC